MFQYTLTLFLTKSSETACFYASNDAQAYSIAEEHKILCENRTDDFVQIELIRNVDRKSVKPSL